MASTISPPVPCQDAYMEVLRGFQTIIRHQRNITAWFKKHRAHRAEHPPSEDDDDALWLYERLAHMVDEQPMTDAVLDLIRQRDEQWVQTRQAIARWTVT